MKIVCRSDNEYNLKIKHKAYRQLQKQVRQKQRENRKHARVLELVEEKQVVDEDSRETAEQAIFDLQDALEDLVLPWLTQVMSEQQPPIDMDEIDEPEDVDDIVRRLLGQEVAGEASPLPASPDSTPTG